MWETSATIALINTPPWFSWMRDVTELLMLQTDQDYPEANGYVQTMKDFDEKQIDTTYATSVLPTQPCQYIGKRLLWNDHYRWAEAMETNESIL